MLSSKPELRCISLLRFQKGFREAFRGMQLPMPTLNPLPAGIRDWLLKVDAEKGPANMWEESKRTWGAEP